MLFAVSPLWDFDPVYHWWQHSDKRFIKNRMKSKDCLASGLPKTDEMLKENSEVDGCTSPPTETTDEASIHLTSGYESETSPISTASLGRQKTLPQSNLCSSSQCTTSRFDETVAQETVGIRNCDGNAAAVKESRENGHGDFLGSSQETLKGSFCGGKPQSGLESSLIENIPQNRSRVASSNSDDRNLSHKDSAEVDQLLPTSRRTSSCSAAVSSVPNKSSDVRPACNRSVSTGTAVRGNRKSFYDNALVADPQAELDLILKELYLNIGSLDETLSNLGDNEDGNGNEDGNEDGNGNEDGSGNGNEDGNGDEDGRLKLSDDMESSVDVFVEQNAEEDSDGNGMDTCDVR